MCWYWFDLEYENGWLRELIYIYVCMRGNYPLVACLCLVVVSA